MKFPALLAFSATVASVAAAPARLDERAPGYCPPGAKGFAVQTVLAKVGSATSGYAIQQCQWVDDPNAFFYVTDVMDPNGRPEFYGYDARENAIKATCGDDETCKYKFRYAYYDDWRE